MASPNVADSLPLDENPQGRPNFLNRKLTFHEVSDRRGFEALQAPWNSLLLRSPDATIFQSWEWQSVWWKYFGRGKTPLVLVCDAAQCTRAIIPLMLKPYVLPWLREIAFLGTGVSDYLDIIAEPGFRREAAQAVVQFLDCDSHRWDFVDLGQIPPGETVDFLEHCSGWGEHVQTEMARHETCPVVPLPDNWEEYRKSLGKSLRFNIGYYERSLAKLYDVNIGLATDDDLDVEMESLFALHARRWRSRRLPGALVGDTIQGFHKEVARKFLERGWLRLYYLKLDHVTQAALYCFTYRDRMYYYLGGFEPRLAKYGLGTILTARAIRDAIESGLSKFDMLRGNEDYKARWRPEFQVNRRLLVRKKSLQSGVAHGLHAMEQRIEKEYKKWAHGH